MEYDEDYEFALTEQGKETLAVWAEALLENGYDNPFKVNGVSVWEAAGFLVANDYSLFDVETTAWFLCQLVPVWDTILLEYTWEMD